MSNIAKLAAQKEALLDELQVMAGASNFSMTKFNKLEKAIGELDEQIKASERAQSLSASRAQPSQISASEWKNFGEQLQAVVSATTKGIVDNRLTKAGLAESDPSSGGYAIQPEISTYIWERMYQEGEWLKRCDHTPISTNTNGLKIPAIDEKSRKVGSQSGGVFANWLSEGDTITESQPKFRIIDFDLKKIAAYWRVSDEMLADAQILASKAPDYFSRALQFQTEDAIVRGTGVGMPAGILGATALVSVASDKGQAPATITFNNALNMISRTWGSLNSYCWFANISCLPQIWAMSQQMGTAGQSVFFPNGGASGPEMRLLGLPLVLTEQSADLGALGDFMLCNMSEYMVVDKASPNFQSSQHVYFQQDQMAFRLVGRVDGQSMWNSALTPAQGSSTKSPFIALAAR